MPRPPNIPEHKLSVPQQNQVALLIAQGLEFHRQGKFNEAKAIYEKVLEIQVNHFDALQLLGALSAQTKEFTKAVDFLTKALQINPHHAACYYNRGNALQELGCADEALVNYDKAIGIKPDYAEAHSNRGGALQQLKRPDEALVSYDKAISIKADYADAYSSRGNALQELGRFNEALASYDKALSIKPDYADAYLNRGIVLKELGRFDEALVSYDKAINLKPDYVEAYSNRGVVLKELKRFDEALATYDKAIGIKADYADAHSNRGNALQELKRFNEALVSYDKAISIKPDYAEAHTNRGAALQQLNRLDEALASYDKAIGIKPDYAEAHLNSSVILQELKRLDEALASYEKSISIKPDYAEAYFNRGNALQQLKRFDEALESYDKAISIKPDYAEAYFNRGNVLKELGRFNEALVSYDKAIGVKPDYGDAHLNSSIVLQELKRFDEALASYDKSISIKPGYAEAFSNRGNALQQLKRFDEALESYDKAISIKPDYAEAHSNRGNVLIELKRLDEALESYKKAISIKPDYAEAYLNCGVLLQVLKRLDEALESYEKALQLKSDLDFAFGNLQHIKMTVCQWDNFAHLQDMLIQKIIGHQKISLPFVILANNDSPLIQKLCAHIFVQEKCLSSQSLGPIPKHSKRDKIRLGYFSADYHNHATTHLMAGFFEAHNKDLFETIAFSFGPDQQDEMRSRLLKSFDQFVDVRNQSDQAVAELSRELKIDIAIDLKGHTGDSRTNIFAYRAAPIQVNYLGYPGTMGADYIDYIVADKTLIPTQTQQDYSEKIVYLPNSYQVNDNKRVISDRQFTRQELGLPGNGFVFCCFNNNYKITPATFDSWMRLLKAVEGSVLWLLEDNPSAAANLKKEAEKRRIDASRLVFAKRMSTPEHLARHSQADLFIDTLPYNAHTTASDALWTGLPVLTLMGESFASRVAASLLKAINLPELITTTQQEYESLAIELATDPQKLAALKEKLSVNRLSAPLFDTSLYTKHIETAYTQMMERYWADLPPDHISIKS